MCNLAELGCLIDCTHQVCILLEMKLSEAPPATNCDPIDDRSLHLEFCTKKCLLHAPKLRLTSGWVTATCKKDFNVQPCWARLLDRLYTSSVHPARNEVKLENGFNMLPCWARLLDRLYNRHGRSSSHAKCMQRCHTHAVPQAPGHIQGKRSGR